MSMPGLWAIVYVLTMFYFVVGSRVNEDSRLYRPSVGLVPDSGCGRGLSRREGPGSGLSRVDAERCGSEPLTGPHRVTDVREVMDREETVKLRGKSGAVDRLTGPRTGRREGEAGGDSRVNSALPRRPRPSRIAGVGAGGTISKGAEQ